MSESGTANIYSAYRDSTYGKTTDKMLADQQARTGWLEEKLGRKPKRPGNATPKQ